MMFGRVLFLVNAIESEWVGKNSMRLRWERESR